MVTKKSQHQFRFNEMDRQKDLSAPDTFNGIKLRDRGIRMICHICTEVLVRTTDTACFVDLEMDRVGPWFKPYFPWEIEVPGGKGAGIDQPVERPFADEHGVPVVDKDVMGRLPLPDQGRNKFINSREFCFRQRETGTCLRKGQGILLMGFMGGIKAFFQSAAKQAVRARIADIRSFQEPGTDYLDKIRTEPITNPTGTAKPITLVCDTAGTDMALLTGETIRAGIEPDEFVADPAKDQVVADFLRDRGPVFAKRPGDAGEGSAMIQHGLDDRSFFPCKVLLFSHGQYLLEIPGHSQITITQGRKGWKEPSLPKKVLLCCLPE